MQLLAKFKKILYMGFRATLNFRKISLSRDLGIPVSVIVFVAWQPSRVF